MFYNKTLNKIGLEENFFNMIKGNYEKPTANIKLNGERVKAFPLRSGEKKDAQFHNFYSTMF